MPTTKENQAVDPTLVEGVPDFSDNEPGLPPHHSDNGDRPRPAPAFVPDPAPLDPRQQALNELQQWLVRKLDGALPEVLRKADEYGSGDLEMMGDRQFRMLRLPGQSVGQQAACAFYVDGKVARIMAALEEGREPSADCWFDLMVYGMIGLKIHETGRWL
jgi:hypothetical protein